MNGKIEKMKNVKNVGSPFDVTTSILGFQFQTKRTWGCMGIVCFEPTTL